MIRVLLGFACFAFVLITNPARDFTSFIYGAGLTFAVVVFLFNYAMDRPYIIRRFLEDSETAAIARITRYD